jgi:hypothetical protein
MCSDFSVQDIKIYFPCKGVRLFLFNLVFAVSIAAGRQNKKAKNSHRSVLQPNLIFLALQEKSKRINGR